MRPSSDAVFSLCLVMVETYVSRSCGSNTLFMGGQIPANIPTRPECDVNQIVLELALKSMSVDRSMLVSDNMGAVEGGQAAKWSARNLFAERWRMIYVPKPRSRQVRLCPFLARSLRAVAHSDVHLICTALEKYEVIIRGSVGEVRQTNAYPIGMPCFCQRDRACDQTDML